MAESQAVADEALKKLEDQLTCAICLDSFKQPKMLNCFHVFCEHCLQRLVVQEREGQLSLRCPTCRRSTLLPQATGVSSLQSAFYVHHLFDVQNVLEKTKEPKKVQCEKCTKVSRPATSFCRDCGQFVCASCVDVHANWKEMSSHEIVSVDQLQGEVTKHVPPKKVTHFCLKHKEQQLRLYCETCEELICHDCTVRLHKGHQYDLIGDTFERHKTEISASVDPVKKQKGIVSEKLTGINVRFTKITNQRDQIEADIHKNVRSLIEMLTRREAELVSQLDQVVQPKLKNLAAQRDEVETILAQLDSCLTVVAESLKTGSEEEILKMKKGVMKQIENMTAEFNEEALTPCEVADVEITILPSLANDCGLLGDIYIKEKSYANGRGLEVAMVNERATAFVYVIDQKEKPYTHHAHTITLSCQLVSNMDSNAMINGDVRQVKDNQYEISYRPSFIGRHQLHLKIDNKHIKASPFAVTVNRSIEKLGTPIKTITGLKYPWGVAVNKKGEIVVVENTIAHCVSVYSRAGEKLRSFGSYGSEFGQFSQPRGVAVDDNGNILVADTKNNRIQKFTEDGKFIASVGSGGNKQLQFNLPTGVAIHPVNKMVYVTESCNHRVQILNPDLTAHGVFGSAGSNKGQFPYPRGIAFDSTGNVYVGEDRSDTRVQIFSAKGEHLRWLGDKLNCPRDITIDFNDTIYVCDSDNHQICIFDTNGKLIRSFGTKGTLPGQFNCPYGIAVNKSGLIYVSDYYNGRVQIF